MTLTFQIFKKKYLNVFCNNFPKHKQRSLIPSLFIFFLMHRKKKEPFLTKINLPLFISQFQTFEKKQIILQLFFKKKVNKAKETLIFLFSVFLCFKFYHSIARFKFVFICKRRQK